MEKLEMIKECLVKGYTYDSISGDITGPSGKIISAKINGYIQMHPTKKISVYGHQFAYYCIFGIVPECIDHINRNKSDNRIVNLRSIPKSKNALNRGDDFKGWVYQPKKNKKNPYIAKIRLNNKVIQLGSFSNADDANKAYLEARAKLHSL